MFQVGQFEGQSERLNFGLVRVVYEWALEKPFAEIMDLTDVQEGIIVRCIQQLHEVREKALLLELFQKFCHFSGSDIFYLDTYMYKHENKFHKPFFPTLVLVNVESFHECSIIIIFTKLV